MDGIRIEGGKGHKISGNRISVDGLGINIVDSEENEITDNLMLAPEVLLQLTEYISSLNLSVDIKQQLLTKSLELKSEDKKKSALDWIKDTAGQVAAGIIIAITTQQLPLAP